MNKYGKTSLVLVSLTLPVTLCISGFVAWQLKETNPDNVDITASLAYLKQILGAALITFGAFWIAGLILALVGLKKDSSKDFSKLALITLVLVTVFSVTAGIANNKASDAEEAHRAQKTREFFDAL